MAVVEVCVDMVAEREILLGRHFVAQSLFYVFTADVAPYDRRFAQTDDIHKTLVFIAPGFGDAEGDVHVGLFGQSGSDTITGCAESAEDMRRKLPSEH